MECAVDKATIYYQVHGERGRPIVFLHGWSMDHRVEMADYEPVFAARVGWRRIYPDLPGMGRSVAQDALATQDDVLEALLAFIDRVLPAERFVLAGTSGAPIWRAPSSPAAGRGSRACCSACPVSLPRTRGGHCRHSGRWCAMTSFWARFDAEERTALDNVLVQTPDYIEALRQRTRSLVQPAIKAMAPVANEIRADPRRYGLSFDLAEAEKSFEEPTLIIAARQDMTVGYRDAWEILESYPRATSRCSIGRPMAGRWRHPISSPPSSTTGSHASPSPNGAPNLAMQAIDQEING